MVVRHLSLQKFSAFLFTLAILLMTGCESAKPGKPIGAIDITPTPLLITQGDVLSITFPGASNLDGQRKVGVDGTITLPLVGEVVAAGKTTQQLRQELLK